MTYPKTAMPDADCESLSYNLVDENFACQNGEAQTLVHIAEVEAGVELSLSELRSLHDVDPFLALRVPTDENFFVAAAADHKSDSAALLEVMSTLDKTDYRDCPQKNVFLFATAEQARDGSIDQVVAMAKESGTRLHCIGLQYDAGVPPDCDFSAETGGISWNIDLSQAGKYGQGTWSEDKQSNLEVDLQMFLEEATGDRSEWESRMFRLRMSAWSRVGGVSSVTRAMIGAASVLSVLLLGVVVVVVRRRASRDQQQSAAADEMLSQQWKE